jgi:uncharacterized membrane protein YeiH
MATDYAFTGLEVLGTVAFAVSGAAVAARAGLDWLGVAVLAVVTAVGGGTLRDLLLGHPVTWLHDPWPVWLAFGVAILAIGWLYGGWLRARQLGTTVMFADAVGLSVFTVAGTEIAVAAGIRAPVAVLLGVVTGAGGGVVRDVLARQRPLVLVGEIYALAALSGATGYVLLWEVSAPPEVARWTGVAITLALRLAAVRWRWALPKLPTGRAEQARS